METSERSFLLLSNFGPQTNQLEVNGDSELNLLMLERKIHAVAPGSTTFKFEIQFSGGFAFDIECEASSSILITGELQFLITKKSKICLNKS